MGYMRNILLALGFFLLLTNFSSAQVVNPLTSGEPFPEISLPTPTDPTDRQYLGLPEAETFTPSQIRGKVLLVELLNVHCPHCRMQSAHYNKLFTMLEADPETRGQVKMLGLAIGNLPDEVKTFRQAFQVPFPIIADPRFEAYRAIGGSATPFSLYVRQTSPGQPGVVAYTHLGMNKDIEQVFQKLRSLVTTDVQSLQQQEGATALAGSTVAPLYPEPELQTKVREAMIATGGTISEFAPVDVGGGRKVYTALLQQGDSTQRIFADVISRTSVCDICHDVHFIYVFDSDGKIIGFTPLHLTKLGNRTWDEKEVGWMRKRVVGRYLTAPKPFDPKVDAVTSATMTSAIIFDSIAQGEKLLQALHEQGLR